MTNYNKSGPGHPLPQGVDPVVIALREAISIMDEAHFASLANPGYKELHAEYQALVILLARIISY